MTNDQEIKKLDDEIIDLILDRMHTKPQTEWERINSIIEAKLKQVKILKAGGSI